MKMMQLSQGGPQVSTLGLGCDSLTEKTKDEKESLAALHAILDAGVSFLDTADFYGMGRNESLIGRALKGRRDDAFLSVKFGMMLSPSGQFLGLEGRPQSVKNFASYSLQRLGVDVIDLYQPGRVDPAVPYEDTIGAIAELIQEGKVRYLGVSEVGADALRRAHSVHPVTALEIEYSLACRFIEPEILPAARELGIGIVAYHVLAGGLLTGRLTGEPVQGDPRTQSPRLQGENLQHNVETVKFLKDMAAEKGFMPVQIALAWLWSRGSDILPIVGMSSPDRLAQNLQAFDVEFSADELTALERAFGPGAIAGDRYPAFVQKFAAS